MRNIYKREWIGADVKFYLNFAHTVGDRSLGYLAPRRLNYGLCGATQFQQSSTVDAPIDRLTGEEKTMIDPLGPWSPEQLRYFGTGFAMVGCAVVFVHALEEQPMVDSSRAVWVLAVVVFGYAWRDTPAIMLVTTASSTVLAIAMPLVVLGRVFYLFVTEEA